MTIDMIVKNEESGKAAIASIEVPTTVFDSHTMEEIEALFVRPLLVQIKSNLGNQ